MSDVELAMRRVNGVPYGVEFRSHPEARVRFLDASRILGSAIAEVRVRDGGRERRMVFSGDLGQPARPVVRDPESVAQADVLLVESTYGNRLHKPMDETVRELVDAARAPGDGSDPGAPRDARPRREAIRRGDAAAAPSLPAAVHAHAGGVHGEESTALAFAGAVTSGLGWEVTVPAPGEAVDC